MCNAFKRTFITPLTTNVPHHIGISQLTCNANQLSGFYMMVKIGRYLVTQIMSFCLLEN